MDIMADVIISIHAPRTGSDLMRSLRFTTSSHFNPRSPHGERRDFGNTYNLYYAISIHAPRTGSDRVHPAAPMTACISIHAPRTGSDSARRLQARLLGISIHAPRTGSDKGPRSDGDADNDFNPRSPHGERH